MSMRTWAEKEVEIACKREREASGTKEEDWNYGAACYESALKAYRSLMGDGHSGCSIGMTKQVLNRLIDGKPLTPIEDTPDVWNEVSDIGEAGEGVSYQCKRMGSLFKYAYADGTVKYRDINSSYCIDRNNPDCSYNCRLVQEIIDEMFPIKMPYFPGKAIAVYCEDFLTDKKNGDFDTRCVFYAIKPGGDRVDINRFFKASECEGGWEEISRAEYVKRKLASIDRK